MPAPINDVKFREDFLIKKFSLQEHDLGRSIFMTVICYSGAISAASTIEQLHGEKRTCARFQIDIPKIEMNR